MWGSPKGKPGILMLLSNDFNKVDTFLLYTVKMWNFYINEQ